VHPVCFGVIGIDIEPLDPWPTILLIAGELNAGSAHPANDSMLLKLFAFVEFHTKSYQPVYLIFKFVTPFTVMVADGASLSTETGWVVFVAAEESTVTTKASGGVGSAPPRPPVLPNPVSSYVPGSVCSWLTEMGVVVVVVYTWTLFAFASFASTA